MIFYNIVSNILIFFVGASFASFFDVISFRDLKKIHFFKYKNSVCDFCKKPINWYDNIPVISFLILKGKSRCCRQPIDKRYFYSEFVGGLFMLFWFNFFDLFKDKVLFLYSNFLSFWIFAFLLAIFITDLFFYFIYDIYIFIILVFSVLRFILLFIFGFYSFYEVVFILGLDLLIVGLFFLFYFLSKEKAFGFGDVKLAIPLYLLLSYKQIVPGVLNAFFLGSIIGTIVVVFRRIFNKSKKDTTLPFAPFMILGVLLAYVNIDLLSFFIFV